MQTLSIPAESRSAVLPLVVPAAVPRGIGLRDALRQATLVSAISVPGIEHRAVASIVQGWLPSIDHERRTISRGLDEHFFLDIEATAGVRVMASWDHRAGRTRMEVAEVGDRYLWDSIVICFTRWEIAGRPMANSHCPFRAGRG